MQQQKINRKKIRENNRVGKKGRTGREQSDVQQTADYSLKGSKCIEKGSNGEEKSIVIVISH